MASDYVSRASKDILPLDHYDWNRAPDNERLCYFLNYFSVEGAILEWVHVQSPGVEALSGTVVPDATAADEGGIVMFADSKSCTRCGVIEEYKLSKREDQVFDTLYITRACNTASCQTTGFHISQHGAVGDREHNSATACCFVQAEVGTGAKSTTLTLSMLLQLLLTQRWIENQDGTARRGMVRISKQGPHALCLWLSWMRTADWNSIRVDKRKG
ncbi:hypothetical protein JKP88DRAFT_256264 [Tribonema minus]|uniref:Uncharacterized protein n=1 Tax=Tribonema minus TaxID=303371 RepID=A0A835YSX0_9STRA|nr:hypothetical protein JKP88DRAFT_256264 [Tribonema minus]